MKIKHKRELFRLMVGLLYVKLKTKFDMECFAESESEYFEPSEIKNQCGTSACALGHGPLFCKTRLLSDMRWEDYVIAAFGINELDREGSYLFDSSWRSDKNQASARAYRFLTKGMPGVFVFDCKFPVPTRKQVNALGKRLKVTVESVVSVAV